MENNTKVLTCMPVNWLDNLPNDLKKRNSLSNSARWKVDTELTPERTTKESWGHIMNGASRSEPASSSQVT